MNKMESLYPNLMEYKKIKLVNILYLIGLICIAIIVFWITLLQSLPGGV